MRKHSILFGAALLLAACSAPKYTYHFDHYDYNSGKKQAVASESPVAPAATETVSESPLAVDEYTLTASTGEPVAIAERTAPAVNYNAQTPEEVRAILAKKYYSLSKSEKKEFRQTAKKQLKAYMKAKQSGNTVAAEEAVQAMDHDLKMAIIFGAVGLTLTLFGGVSEAFWILGVIAIVVGVVFLVKWLVRQ